MRSAASLVAIYVAVHGLKLEIGNLGEMKRDYELDVYKLAEELSDIKSTIQTQPHKIPS
jgi:hypothetical protein